MLGGLHSYSITAAPGTMRMRQSLIKPQGDYEILYQWECLLCFDNKEKHFHCHCESLVYSAYNPNMHFSFFGSLEMLFIFPLYLTERVFRIRPLEGLMIRTKEKRFSSQFPFAVTVSISEKLWSFLNLFSFSKLERLQDNIRFNKHK